jgi:hypothetical protein
VRVHRAVRGSRSALAGIVDFNEAVQQGRWMLIKSSILVAGVVVSICWPPSVVDFKDASVHDVHSSVQFIWSSTTAGRSSSFDIGMTPPVTSHLT